MRYALFSDVHAYPPALERALEDMEGQNVDFRICLGDVVGYGPDPAGAVALCRERCDVVVAGNHDAAVVRQISTAFFIPRAQEAVARHQDQISDEHLKWLAHLPMSIVRDGFAAAHGEFHRGWRRQMEAGFGYVLSDWDAERTLDALPSNTTLAFVGHTHAACIWRRDGDPSPRLQRPKDFTLEPGVRYVVNVGSIGYPRYHFETNYVIYDSVASTVAFRHLPFDFADYCACMERIGVELPLWLCDHMRAEREKSCSSR